jgi:FGGY family of carbohydrate kinases, N-terminal domain
MSPRPRPGWTEQVPEAWWRDAKEALGKVTAGVDDEVIGLGLTGQMHGSVFLDPSDEVIRPAPVKRPAHLQTVRRDNGGGGRGAPHRAGRQPRLTGFQVPKILWLHDEEPENFSRVANILLPKPPATHESSLEMSRSAVRVRSSALYTFCTGTKASRQKSLGVPPSLKEANSIMTTSHRCTTA